MNVKLSEETFEVLTVELFPSRVILPQNYSGSRPRWPWLQRPPKSAK